jgi:general nucleoside transport system ATP-binding protein
VAENVALGMENPPPQRQLSARIREVSETYGLPLDPYRLVGDLSAGERQRVEIIRCLLQDPKLLIMDEPTSVLTPQEVGILFETLRKLAHEGTAILYISHKLEEIRALCEAATILRLGKVVATCDPREKSARELAELMVGQTLHTPSRGEAGARGGAAGREPVGRLHEPLRHDAEGRELRGAQGRGARHRRGRRERAGRAAPRAVGRDPGACGAIRVGGTPVGALGPSARRRIGLLAAPEERLGHAAAPDMSLTENALLTGLIREGLSNGAFSTGARRAASRSGSSRLRRADAGAGACGAVAVGRQPPEVRDRAGDPPEARRARRQPADLGRRRRGRGAIRQALLDLAARGRRSWSSARTSTSSWRSPTASPR